MRASDAKGVALSAIYTDAQFGDLCWSADKTTVVAMMQSPMYRGEDQSSMQMRVITMDVRRATQPARAALRGPHLSVC